MDRTELNTLIDDHLTVVDQIPGPRGVLPAADAVEVQFNRILDPTQLNQLGSSLFEVVRSGIAVEGYLSSQVNNTGTRLFFRPAEPFEDQSEYRVRISSALTRESDGRPIRAAI